MRQPQHFHRQMFQRQQEFSLVLQQQLGFRSAEFHHDIRVFNLRISGCPFNKFIVNIDVDRVEQDVQKVANLVFELFYWIFTRHGFRTGRKGPDLISSSLH